MFQILLQIFCEILLIFAAVKYLMPDIRKICKKIADGGEAKEKEIRTKKPALPVAPVEATSKQTDKKSKKILKKEESKEPAKQPESDTDDKDSGIRDIPNPEKKLEKSNLKKRDHAGKTAGQLPGVAGN